MIGYERKVECDGQTYGVGYLAADSENLLTVARLSQGSWIWVGDCDNSDGMEDLPPEVIAAIDELAYAAEQG